MFRDNIVLLLYDVRIGTIVNIGENGALIFQKIKNYIWKIIKL